MRKRITCIVLTLFLISGGVLSRYNMMPVRAASPIASSAESTAELLTLIYSLLESAMIASGVKEGIDDYASGKSLSDAFRHFVKSVSAPDLSGLYPDSVFQLSDGTVVTIGYNYNELIVNYQFSNGCTATSSFDDFLSGNVPVAVGTAVLEPGERTEEQQAEWEELLRAHQQEAMEVYILSKTGGSGDNSDPTPSPEPEKGLFSKVSTMLVGGGLLVFMGSFVKSLWNGEVEGLNKNDYLNLPEYCFDGYQQDENLNYILKGVLTQVNVDDVYRYDIDGTVKDKIVAYLSPSGSIQFINEMGGYNIPYIYNRIVNGNIVYTGSVNYGANFMISEGMYRLNIPVFENEVSAQNFFKFGSLAGLLNGVPYDFPGLADSVPETLSPLTGIAFSPGQMPKINQSLSTAAKTQTETSMDTALNNQMYQDTINDAATQNAPSPVPQPSPDILDTDIETETGSASANKYKRDLRMIFPFCLPFDLVHFLQALKAEPEAPCFEIPFVVPALNIDMKVKLDLSFLDPVMKIFRLGELGFFIISLIIGTRKMIKW